MSNTLTRVEWVLLRKALEMEGMNEYTLGYIFEDLTWEEYERLDGFVKWMISHNKTVGSANYQKVFSEYWEGRDV